MGGRRHAQGQVTPIVREKQLKNWRREKKVWLIETLKPEWQGLAAEWFH